MHKDNKSSSSSNKMLLGGIQKKKQKERTTSYLFSRSYNSQSQQKQQQQKHDDDNEKKKTHRKEREQVAHAAESFPRSSSQVVPSLSSMQQKMKAKLQGAHFRFLNEKLYTCSGNQAFSMFQNDPSLFDAYHQGYREQARQWPENPLHQFIDIVNRHRGKVVADMGCGEGILGKSATHNQVHSFDLVAAAPHITACDIAHVPLKSESVDIVVFCLSLMGTNYHDFLVEGVRILSPGGIMLIAEVRSRIASIKEFIEQLKQLGLSLTYEDSTNTMFFILHFKKTLGKLKKQHKQSEGKPQQLKPCVYKRR